MSRSLHDVAVPSHCVGIGTPASEVLALASSSEEALPSEELDCGRRGSLDDVLEDDVEVEAEGLGARRHDSLPYSSGGGCQSSATFHSQPARRRTNETNGKAKVFCTSKNLRPGWAHVK